MSNFSRQTSGSLLWEVLAPAARWPLHSPARLGALIALILLGFAACSRGGDEPGPAPTGQTTVTATVTATPTISQTIATPSSASTSASMTPAPTTTPSQVAPSTRPAVASPLARPGADDVREVAAAFTAAWARRGTAAAQWRTDLVPYTTPEYQRRLATVDPARIPATRVTGPAVVKHVDTTSATVEIPTDGGRVEVRLTRKSATWRVTDVTPVQVAIVETVPPMTAVAVPSTAGRR